MEIRTRQQTREQGLSRYYTGIPCTRGHVAERYTTTASCQECTQIYDAKARESGKKKNDTTAFIIQAYFVYIYIGLINPKNWIKI